MIPDLTISRFSLRRTHRTDRTRLVLFIAGMVSRNSCRVTGSLVRGGGFLMVDGKLGMKVPISNCSAGERRPGGYTPTPSPHQQAGKGGFRSPRRQL